MSAHMLSSNLIQLCTFSSAQTRDPLLQDIEELQKSFMVMTKVQQDTQGLWFMLHMYSMTLF